MINWVGQATMCVMVTVLCLGLAVAFTGFIAACTYGILKSLYEGMVCGR